MRELAFEAFKKGRFPADVYYEAGHIFSVKRYSFDEKKLLCKIRDDEKHLVGFLRIKESRVKNMTFSEFCRMLDIMEARTMKPITREQEQETKER